MTFKNLFHTRDVEAVEYFLLPLPAPYKVSRFWICLHFRSLSSTIHRNVLFHIFKAYRAYESGIYLGDSPRAARIEGAVY